MDVPLARTHEEGAAARPVRMAVQRCFAVFVEVEEVDLTIYFEERRQRKRERDKARMAIVRQHRRLILPQFVQTDFGDLSEEDASASPWDLDTKPRVGVRAPRKWTKNQRPTTVPMKPLNPREAALGFKLRVYYGERPKTRAECVGGPRPCPYVTCQHHLYLDVNADTGAIKYNHPHLDVLEMTESCSLDVADRGGIGLEELGLHFNVTLEGARQLEKDIVEEVAAKMGLTVPGQHNRIAMDRTRTLLMAAPSGRKKE